jgi:hypothetical protein
MHYILEALVIAILTSIIGFAISTLLMYMRNPDFSFKQYDFWPYVLLGYFITGMLIHLVFEWSGGNKWYCKNGDACVN